MTVLSPPLPLPLQHWQQLQAVIEQLEPAQLNWLSGYLAGLAAPQGSSAASLPPPATPLKTTVLYATHTGNGKGIARTLQQELQAQGLDARLVSARDYATRELKEESLLFAVVSTHGEGEPPEDAKDFFAFLHSRRAPKLKSLRYAVLALGDSSYPLFCAAGAALDERLRALGAQALHTRIEADTDFSGPAAQFRTQVLQTVQSLHANSAPKAPPLSVSVALPARFDRDTAFAATVLCNQRITSHAAGKDVRHIEFDVQGSGLHYEPGDALGVRPQNSVQLVDELLRTGKRDGSETAVFGKPLREALLAEREITQLSLPVLKKYAELRADTAIGELLLPGRHASLRAFLAQYQLIDLLQQYGLPEDFDALLASLRPLSPRLYSIASSTAEVGDEVHITVGVRDYEAFHARRYGAASTYLAARNEGDSAPIYIQANESFRLPADNEVPLILIGAGTGIAPYRAFLQQRVAQGARGKHWLFFGEQKRRDTFLYQNEWLDWHKKGALQRIDVAFSRDSANKIYVQQRVREQAADIWRWLQDGAQIYVCGDAQGMAPSVHEALRDIAILQGGKTPEAADEYWQQLSRERRYLKDVY